jgi:tRNA (cytosine49-C5)-methyltransferase
MKRKKHLSKELPAKFLERLAVIAGSSLFPSIRKTFNDRHTTFRVNTIRAQRAEVQSALRQLGFHVTHVPWSADAFVLQNKSKRELTDTQMYKDGKIYIQGLASMIPPLVLDPQPGEAVLDLTAAPGSKTSQIAAMMNRRGELVANELNKVRFFRLQHNMDMLGVPDDGEAWTFTLRMEDGSVLSKEYPEYFDRILVDAPCSGESRFIEGVPKTYGYWNEKKIKRLAYRQHKLLMAAWTALKQGGVLVYSTCTFAPEENEARVSKVKERLGDACVVEPISLGGLKKMPCHTAWKGKTYHPDVLRCLRVLPAKDIEGFFVARMRKRA